MCKLKCWCANKLTVAYLATRTESYFTSLHVCEVLWQKVAQYKRVLLDFLNLTTILIGFFMQLIFRARRVRRVTWVTAATYVWKVKKVSVENVEDPGRPERRVLRACRELSEKSDFLDFRLVFVLCLNVCWMDSSVWLVKLVSIESVLKIVCSRSDILCRKWGAVLVGDLV